MTTQEIANRLVELCRQGDFDTCYAELYSPNVRSIETEGSETPVAVGMEGIREKGKKWNEMVENFYGAEISEPIVADNHFALTMTMDIQYKGAPRMKDEELCVYEVQDGKIVKEQFFYQLPS